MSKDEYAYRRPRWFVVLFLVFGFSPPLLYFVAVAVHEGSWLIGIGGGVVVLLMAGLAARFWRKVFIIIDSDGIRWPQTGREVRWSEVHTSRIVKFLIFDYVRVTTKSGKVRWIALDEPGGRELRSRILTQLRLSLPDLPPPSGEAPPSP